MTLHHTQCKLEHFVSVQEVGESLELAKKLMSQSKSFSKDFKVGAYIRGIDQDLEEVYQKIMKFEEDLNNLIETYHFKDLFKLKHRVLALVREIDESQSFTELAKYRAKRYAANSVDSDQLGGASKSKMAKAYKHFQLKSQYEKIDKQKNDTALEDVCKKMNQNHANLVKNLEAKIADKEVENSKISQEHQKLCEEFKQVSAELEQIKIETEQAERFEKIYEK